MEEFSSFLFSLFLISLPLLSTSQFLDNDTTALFVFKSALGTNTHSMDTWTPVNYTCTAWIGVYCNSTDTGPRVSELRLPGSWLAGAIPLSSISKLTSLRILSLRHNLLTSPLPDDLSVHRNLTAMYLNNNSFTGPIPAVISSMISLQRLDISSNNFSGGVPVLLNNLTQLNYLLLHYNNLSGTLPQDLNIPNLATFNVSYNSELYGQIPPSLTKFPASAFLSTKLCGGPLKPCSIGPTPSPSPSSPSPFGPSPAGGKKKLSAGAIAGIAIASAVALAALIILLVVLFRKGQGQNDNQSAQTNPPAWGQAAVPTAMPSERPVNQSNPPSAGQHEMENAAPYSAAPLYANAVSAPASNAITDTVPSAVPVTTSSTAPAALPVPLVGPKSRSLSFFRKGKAPKFDLEQLLRASAEVLGRGTFGTTYKVTLESGDMVAVKRVREVYVPQREFREKIARVGELDHDNIVPLIAFYYSKDETLLVYDFMPMGSLSAVLHGSRGSGRTPLNWESRANIAMAVSRGLRHIHAAGPTFSHGNIKSSNVLLTATYEARLSDHGLFSFANTNTPASRVAGYRAPEVTDPKRVSQKADMYSFGVLVLELLTGKAPAQAVLSDGVDLPRWVQSVLREDWTGDVFDMDLVRYQNAGEDMMQLLQIGIDCTKQFPDQRPGITEVVARIEEIVKNRDVSASGESGAD